MTTFTVDHVRELACKTSYEYKRECGDMLQDYADRLEADEKGVPFGYAYRYGDGIRFDTGGREINGSKPTATIPLYTHPAPSDAEKRDTMTPRELAKRIERGEKWKLADEPTPCQSRDAERLAEALRDILEIGKRNMENHKYDGFFNAAREALADHSAQAHPPVASVTDAMAVFEVVSGVEGPCLTISRKADGKPRHEYRLAGPKPWGGGNTTHSFKVHTRELREQIDAIEAALAAQENPNG